MSSSGSRAALPRWLTTFALVLLVPLGCGRQGGTLNAGILVSVDETRLCIAPPTATSDQGNAPESQCYTITERSRIPSDVRQGDLVEVRAVLRDGRNEVVSVTAVEAPSD